MSTSTDNPGGEKSLWRAATTSGRIAAFQVSDRAAVGDVLAKGDHVEWFEYAENLDGIWQVTVRLEVTKAGLELVSVHIDPRSDAQGGGSRWELLKLLGLGELRRRITRRLDLLSPMLPTNDMLRVAQSRPGRRARPDSFYAAKARAWVEALAEEPNRPTTRLVELHPSTTVKQWQGWLKIAEERGLFERPCPPPAGRAAGHLTRKGIDTLRGDRP